MNLVWVIALAVALGSDAFSLSLAIGLSGIRKGLMLKFILVVGLFHVVMPLSGMVLGQALGTILGQFASCIGALVIIGLGGHMLYKVYRPTEESFSFSRAKEALVQKKLFMDISYKGWSLYVLAASVSLDALSVGFSLGTFGVNILLTVAVIGFTASAMTGVGLVLGRVMGTRLGDRAELFGGLALLLIGFKLFF
ncbi:manganese efflux pump MntP family protein [Desulfosporosinus sp. PR]|uniref:manganese efflux pump MntP n=1 Tax=Candidatus Desulfosporosinus nitrosoreducens TaxID=3401928 RepID=UPI0027F09D1B|nr:manganese efflux pump MntP family protein [Desulfosporosinus sp. PR]MDQ7093018.1 manganese efflux pump MntP family protein [Desulfosporosinus sp. PR]